MQSQFLAVDSTTDLRARARVLKRSWAEAMGGAEASAVRPVIGRSWQRLAAAGIDPARLEPRQAITPADVLTAREASPLHGVIDVLRSCLLRYADDTEHLMVVADGAGRILWVDGSSRVRRQAEGITFLEGMLWTEESAGTNAIGTALAIDHAVQIFSAEHFLPQQHAWWCSAAPIHHPATGELIGIVDLSGPARTAHPISLSLVAAAARVAEEVLLVQHTAALAHGGAPLGTSARRPQPPAVSLLGPAPPALIAGGQKITLSPRHAEILALLLLCPEGLTTRELSSELHGPGANPVTTRAELSRLRTATGGLIAGRPYRLTAPLRSDFATVERCLIDGDVDAALKRFRGSMLPASVVPRIVRARDQLDAAMRRAVRSDPALLWRWLESPPGRADVTALQEFIRTAAHDDPRRSVAAARLRVRQLSSGV